MVQWFKNFSEFMTILYDRNENTEVLVTAETVLTGCSEYMIICATKILCVPSASFPSSLVTPLCICFAVVIDHTGPSSSCYHVRNINKSNTITTTTTSNKAYF